ncbi:recombinase family protein [Polaribacter sp. Z022]|uniref:recombinase family protein n=1 Tax=Polaribacter sp. Z022 TaxID=2927125 RepID=UPI00202297F8|nr:recombinase family protein [Polaribacter sp. Z022]MCL7753071.1 recombinase family protein [Polaribacter sp. Z022]
MHTKKDIKYFIYARKSTESDDKQMASIEDQIAEARKLATQLNLEIVDIISESKSAKEPGRNGFNEMIARIRNNEAQGVLTWKLNRLARNPIDGGIVIDLLQKNTIKHIQTYGKEYLPTDNVIMMYIEFGMSNQFSNDLSVDVKRGMRQKAERGWYPCAVLPIGYIHNVGKQFEDEIIPDPKRFSIVQRLWKLLLKGNYSVSDLKREAKKMGLVNRKGKPYALNTFAKLFENEFYAGYFSWRNNEGILTQLEGKHKRMITYSEFKKGQEILKNKGRPTRVNSYNFPYRGPLSCGECDSPITAEHKLQIRCTRCNTKFSFKNRTSCKSCELPIQEMKKPTITEKVYYRCTKRKKKCSQPYIEQDKLTEIIMKYLQDICIDEDFFNLAIACLDATEKEDVVETQKLKQSLLKCKTELSTRLDGLITLRLNNEISADEMKATKSQINEQMEELESKLKDIEIATFSWREQAKETLKFNFKAIEIFKNGDNNKKKEVLSKFGSNLRLKDKSLYFIRDYRSEIIQEWHRLYCSKIAGFEPEKSLILKGENLDFSDFEAVTSRVLPRLKFVRTSELLLVA